MKIAVLGCGAMGALYGGYLSQNNEVTLVDRNPERIAKIQKDGLRIAEPDGSAKIYRPGVTGDTSGMQPVDLVILFVKAMQSEAALEKNRALIGRDTYLMTLQNGSGHEETLRRFADDAHIVIGTTQHNSAVTGVGEIRHGGSGWTHIGPLTGDAARLEAIRTAFASCGFETDCMQDIKRLIWQKMLTNVSASVLTGVLQVPMGFIAENPNAWALCETLVREAVAVAAGCAPLVKAYDEGKKATEKWENGDTIAFAIFDPVTFEGVTALDTVRRSGGRAVAIPDDKILDAMRACAKMEAVIPEPASAATIAAAVKLHEDGAIGDDDRVVCVLTGSGLRDLKLFNNENADIPSVKPGDMDSLKQAVEHYQK